MKYCNKFIFPAKLFILLIAFGLFGSTSYSQSSPAIVTGKLVDSISLKPLAFATVQVYDSKQKKLVNGDIVTETGEFSMELPFGEYYAILEFLSYPAFTTAPFILSSQNSKHDLGVIRLVSKRLFYRMW